MASTEQVHPRQDSEFIDDVEKKVHPDDDSSNEKLGYVDTVTYADDANEELVLRQAEELEVFHFLNSLLPSYLLYLSLGPSGLWSC